MYYLYHVNGLNYIELRDGMTFGRTTATKIFSDDSKMSGEHCRFSVRGDEVYVEDLNSKNRTIVDRFELIPAKLSQLKLHSILEVGHQRFIMTDKNLSMMEIDKILSSQQGKQVAKLETAKLVQDIQNKLMKEVDDMLENEKKLTSQLIEKKFKLSDAKKSIINLAKDTQEELRKLDEQKTQILNTIVEKEDALQSMIKTLDNDTQVLTNQIQKLQEEIELKKKKVKK